MSDEIGLNEHTPHTHVFVCFTSAVRFSQLKRHFPTAHIESARGTIQANIDYLTKKGKWAETEKAETSVEGSFEEFGERPPENRGRRGDLEELYHLIVDEQLSNAEILALNKDYILQIDKLDKIRTTYLQDKFRGTRRLDIVVTYVYGLTGKGKTRDILDEHSDEHTYRVTDYKHPFDGYTTESVLVFEEFRDSLPLKDMLNYLDIYPIQLSARYANKYACYNYVYICTNWPLERQYEFEQHDDPASWKAFLRRIHKVKVYTETGIDLYNSVQDYYDRVVNTPPFQKPSKEEQLKLKKLFKNDKNKR